MKPEVTIYTDGGYSANTNLGGWAAYLSHGAEELCICGHVHDTTNNRMEMQAVINALSKLTIPCKVQLFSDSQYVVKGLTSWLSGWKRKNWVGAGGKPVLNRDLWEVLDQLRSYHTIHAQWVRGHNGNVGNEICDSLATEVVTYYPW